MFVEMYLRSFASIVRFRVTEMILMGGTPLRPITNYSSVEMKSLSQTLM